MASSFPSAFNPEYLTYSDPKDFGRGGGVGTKIIYVSLSPPNGESSKLIVQTPEMTAPFGLSEPNEKSSKYAIDLSFRDHDRRPTLAAFLDSLRKMDDKIINDAFKNVNEWLPGTRAKSRDAIEAIYNPCVKTSMRGNYPPTISLKLPMKDGAIDKESFTMYNESKTEFYDVLTTPLHGAKMTCIIQCTGIWIAAGRFGVMWKVMQAMYRPSSGIPKIAIDIRPEDRIAALSLADDASDFDHVASEVPVTPADTSIASDGNADSEDAVNDEAESAEGQATITKRRAGRTGTRA